MALVLATLLTMADLEPPAPQRPEAATLLADFEAPAPRWPGAAALLAGATTLTVASGYGALSNGIFPFCTGRCTGAQNTIPLRQTAFTIGGGVIAILAGMMWFAWTQDPDERPPGAPGMTAVLTGAAEIVGGGLRALIANTTRFEPDHSNQLASCAIIIGSGIVELAAGIAWFIWAHR